MDVETTSDALTPRTSVATSLPQPASSNNENADTGTKFGYTKFFP
jgi:hypothetical protein